ncbi:MAG TPA: hypothetical protein VEI82_06350 [Myxococcota bacterium]|nr:hypothetical protein [Myxococcota bacterium]
MKRSIALIAFGALALGGAAANAAPIDVHVVVCAAAGGCTVRLPSVPITSLSQNDLAIFNGDAGVTLGAVSLAYDAAPQGFLTPTALVDAPDSLLNPDSLTPFLIVVDPPGAPFNGAAGNVGWFLLGNFTLGGHFTPCAAGTCGPANGLSEDPVDLDATVFDGELVNPIANDFQIVPEPHSIVLLGLAAGLALSRGRARV